MDTSIEKKTEQKNLMLHTARFLATCFVVFIHCPFPGVVGTICIHVGRFAVPFFFMLSGYFSVKEDKSEERGKIGASFRKIGFLFLFVFAFYAALNVFVQWNRGSLEAYLADVTNWQNILYLLVCNWTTPFVGVGHIWYLLAMIQVYGIYWIALKGKIGEDFLRYYSLFALTGIFALQILDCYGILSFNDVVWRNGLFEGIALFTLGRELRHISGEEGGFQKINKWWAYLIAGFAFIGLLLLEYYLFKENFSLFPSSLLLASAAFLIGSCHKRINIPLITWGGEIIQPHLLLALRHYRLGAGTYAKRAPREAFMGHASFGAARQRIVCNANRMGEEHN